MMPSVFYYALLLGWVVLISVANSARSSSTLDNNAQQQQANKKASSIKGILTEVGFTVDEIDSIFDDRKQLVKRILDPTNEREIAMAFAVLIQDTPDDLRDVFISLRLKEKVDPGVTGVGMISDSDASVADFKGVLLEPGGKDVAKELVHSNPEDEWNLSREEIADFHKLEDEGSEGSQKERVESSLREKLLERYQSYRQKGLEGILPYARSKGSDYYPGDDMHMSSKMHTVLQREAPAFHEHLAHFPARRPDNLFESFSWVTFDADGKPNVELLHRCGIKENDSFFFSERQYFALNAYNCVHGEGGAVPLGDDIGTLLLFSSRTSTDAVTGFGGRAKRAIGVRMMGKMVSDLLERYQEEQNQHNEL
jgi:hypothetical protein